MNACYACNSNSFMNNKMLRWYTLALMGLLMVGCAVLPPLSSEDQADRWQQRQAELLQLQHWVIHGRIALRHNDEQWHANVRWRQDQAHFDIQLFGPFGRDIARIQGNSEGVTLRTGEGEHYLAQHVDELTQQVLGWPLPAAGLRYWILGHPQPSRKHNLKLSPQGQLDALQQSGWEIRYERYHEAPLHLPQRMRLQYENIYLRLLIDEWHTWRHHPDAAEEKRTQDASATWRHLPDTASRKSDS